MPRKANLVFHPTRKWLIVLAGKCLCVRASKRAAARVISGAIRLAGLPRASKFEPKNNKHTRAQGLPEFNLGPHLFTIGAAGVCVDVSARLLFFSPHRFATNRRRAHRWPPLSSPPPLQ